MATEMGTRGRMGEMATNGACCSAKHSFLQPQSFCPAQLVSSRGDTRIPAKKRGLFMSFQNAAVNCRGGEGLALPIHGIGTSCGTSAFRKGFHQSQPCRRLSRRRRPSFALSRQRKQIRYLSLPWIQSSESPERIRRRNRSGGGERGGDAT